MILLKGLEAEKQRFMTYVEQHVIFSLFLFTKQQKHVRIKKIALAKKGVVVEKQRYQDSKAN